MPPVLTDQERLFQAYLAMGPGRSHEKLHKLVSANPQAYGLAYAPSLRNIKEWSSLGEWSRRIRDPDGLARERAERQRLERIEEHRERLYERGLELQERGAELLRGVPANDVKLNDVVNAIDEGLTLEARALQVSTDGAAHLALTEEQSERLTDREANTLSRLLQKAAGDVPEKPHRLKKRKLSPWEFDSDKYSYMTPPERRGYLEKLGAVRRSYPTNLNVKRGR